MDLVDVALGAVQWWARAILWCLLTLYVVFAVFKVHVRYLGSAGSSNITVTGLATAFINLTAFVYLYVQIPLLQLLFARVASMSPVHELLTNLHSFSFLAVTVLIVVRAFYVISEFDNGLYSLSPTLPSKIAEQNLFIRALEVTLRFAIILILLLCASSLMKKSSPFNLRQPQFSLAGNFGSPALAATNCTDYLRIARTAGQGNVTSERCMQQEISELDVGTTLSTIGQFFNQISSFPLVYVAMLAWSILMRVLVGRFQTEPNGSLATVKKVVTMQLCVPALALVQFLVMWGWIEIAVKNQCTIVCLLVPSMDQQLGQRVDLAILSIGGSVVGFGVLTLLTLRSVQDGRGILRLIRERRRERAKPAAA